MVSVEKSVALLYLYLKRTKRNFKTDDTRETFQSLISCVLKGSILGPILFNIFLNDLPRTLETQKNIILPTTILFLQFQKEKQHY